MLIVQFVSEFRIDSGVRHGYIMSTCLFNVYINGVMKEVKMGTGRRGMSFLENRREWRLPGLLYVDDLVLCSELGEDLRAIVGWFAEQGDGTEWRGGIRL